MPATNQPIAPLTLPSPCVCTVTWSLLILLCTALISFFSFSEPACNNNSDWCGSQQLQGWTAGVWETLGMPVNQAEVGRTGGGWWCWCGLSHSARCAGWSTARWRSHQKREYSCTRKTLTLTDSATWSETSGGSWLLLPSFISSGEKKLHYFSCSCKFITSIKQIKI